MTTQTLDTRRLGDYLARHIPGFKGPLRAEKFAGGQSNPTFKLSAGGQCYVLRRKPPGELLKSAHAVDREYRVITALRDTPVPVPRTFVLCEDEGIIGSMFYVMEYMENGSLEDLLRAGPIPVHDAVVYFREIAVALVHAHDKGILHCDLKPGNVLLDHERRPRLADFGQSRLTNEMSPALGTLYYMAPEQADLTATPDARAFAWDARIDGDRIRRDVERSLEGLRDFQFDMPPMRFHFDREFDDLVAPSSRRRLGVSVDSLSDQLAQYFGAAQGGALVTTVEKESAAEKAGLKAGDVITAINGQPVRDADQVRRALREAATGEVTISYLRDKQSATTKATMAPREPRRTVRPV